MGIEPRVFQGSPECLDHRIREGHLDLSKDARQFLVIQQIIDQLSAGCSARGGEGEAFEYLGLRIRKLPLGFDSRRSVESGELPFGTYRQTHAGGWGGSEMPCAFKALQLQRFASRMFWGVAVL